MLSILLKRQIRTEIVSQLRSIEICAGAGGQALGLEQAGFDPAAPIENDKMPKGTWRWRVHGLSKTGILGQMDEWMVFTYKSGQR